MAKKKYYAVRCGIKPGIYETWAECEAQTKGFSGAKFKSFGSLAEAKNYMALEEKEAIEREKFADSDSVIRMNDRVEEELRRLGENEVVAFSDGSYSPTEEKSGFGVIIIDEKGNQTTFCKSFTKDLCADFLELRNVAAELEGVKEAIKWAIENKKTKIKIYYDYAGIENWWDGSWQAKKDITREYVAFLREKQEHITIEFCKVPAHSGIKYNEMADQLAKNTLVEN